MEGTVTDCRKAKKLLKKIDRHRDSGSHRKCKEILDTRTEDRIGESLRASQSLFEKQHKDNIETTEKVFRTAYECAKSQLSFAEHPRLVDLQELNGISCGKMLFSEHSSATIVEHVGSEMRSEIISHVMKSKSPFSILVDESTSVSNAQSFIVYIRTVFDGEICVYFLGLLLVTFCHSRRSQRYLLWRKRAC